MFVSRIRRKAEAVALFAMLCAFASPAHAWHLFGQGGSPHATEAEAHPPPSSEQGADERRQRRAEHQQLRDELRNRQREGLAPANGGWEQDAHRMSPEERRQFRRDIDDAGREVYGPKRGPNR